MGAGAKKIITKGIANRAFRLVFRIAPGTIVNDATFTDGILTIPMIRKSEGNEVKVTIL